MGFGPTGWRRASDPRHGPKRLARSAPVFADTDYGFAAALMGSVNLPSLGQGDSAWLALTYTDGAIGGYILGGSNLAAVIGAGPLGLPSRTPTSTR